MFSALIGAAMAVVLMVLVPIAGRTLAERTRAIRSDLAHALLVERQFIHPVSGLTIYISETGNAGEMAGLFLNDQRDPERVITYSAERALFLRQGTEARLVMEDGVALATDGDELNTVQFEQFVFDLSELLESESARVPRPSEYTVFELLDPTPEMLATDRYTRGDFIAEAHYKLSMPLLTMIYPMIALVTFLAGGYRRSGFGRRVVVAVGVAVIVQISAFACEAQVAQRPALWPLMYLPHLLGLSYVAVLLLYLGSCHRPRRAAAAGAPA
jgi:lipopolysaccharide export system permease protein